jgi:nucleotide-binding universal stress UspA family protein
MKITDILVPTDFSANSLRAIDFAISLVDQDGDIYLLHVIDSDFIARLSQEGFSLAETATAQLREKAEERMRDILQSLPPPHPRIESMIVIGRPFIEILKVASDLDFQMVVMGIHGMRGDAVEDLLFGTTAEKVLRGTRIPVICVPGVVVQ